jgi:MFS family permease
VNRGRTVRLYFGFQFFFALLFWLPIFYEYQRQIGLSDPQIFAIQSFYYIAFCLLEIPTGMVADQLGYRRCMRAGASVLVVANLLPIFAQNYLGFLCHFLLIALARSFISGSSAAYLYNFLQRHGTSDDYKLVEGRARAGGLVGKMLGWSIVGAMMQWHFTLPYWLTVGAAALSLGFALGLPDIPPPALAPGEDASLTGRLSRTATTIRETPILGLIILQGVALFVLARICQVNLFQPILGSKGFSLASYGLVMSMMTAFEAMGSASSSKLRNWISDFAAVFVLTTGLALALLLIPLASQVTTLVLLATFSTCSGLAFPIQRQVLNDAIPDSRYRATILSLESIVDRAVNAWLASMIGGFLVAGQLDIYLRGAACLTVLFMALLFWARFRFLKASENSLATSKD